MTVCFRIGNKPLSEPIFVWFTKEHMRCSALMSDDTLLIIPLQNRPEGSTTEMEIKLLLWGNEPNSNRNKRGYIHPNLSRTYLVGCWLSCNPMLCVVMNLTKLPQSSQSPCWLLVAWRLIGVRTSVTIMMTWIGQCKSRMTQWYDSSI